MDRQGGVYVSNNMDSQEASTLVVLWTVSEASTLVVIWTGKEASTLVVIWTGI